LNWGRNADAGTASGTVAVPGGWGSPSNRAIAGGQRERAADYLFRWPRACPPEDRLFPSNLRVSGCEQVHPGCSPAPGRPGHHGSLPNRLIRKVHPPASEEAVSCPRCRCPALLCLRTRGSQPGDHMRRVRCGPAPTHWTRRPPARRTWAACRAQLPACACPPRRSGWRRRSAPTGSALMGWRGRSSITHGTVPRARN